MTDKEIWKAIDGYSDYKVSNLGRVMSLKRNKPFIMKPYKTGDYAYLTVDLEGKNKKVHRLVAETFLPKLQGKDQVNHINEDKFDNSVENLEWVTAKENSNHGTRNEKIKFAMSDPEWKKNKSRSMKGNENASGVRSRSTKEKMSASAKRAWAVRKGFKENV